VLRLADIVRRHGPAYEERHRGAILPGHVRAMHMHAIVRCRTPALGGHLAACAQCGREHVLYHSCSHRACPRCGHDTTTRWLDRQRDLLLAVPYFHVVFTLPAELRRVVRSHPKPLLAALFRAAFSSLATLCADRCYLGGQIGALAVLHTWTRTLDYHPHVHMLVPGGALAPNGEMWLSAPKRRKRYLVPAGALAKLFRARFLRLARRASSNVALPNIPWGKSWVVFAKPVTHGADRLLAYLGRYLHRTALTDSAIVRCDDRTVTFRYRDGRDHRRKTMTLSANEFLRRFLQHVLPKGFHRVRAFGLLHPAHRATLRRLQLLLAPRPPSPSVIPAETAYQRLRPRCPHCGDANLVLVRRLSAAACVLMATLAESTIAELARGPPTAGLNAGAANP